MADTILPGQGLTIADYLEFEKTSPVKHEFVGGRLYTKTGTTKRHNLVALNIYRKLIGSAEDMPC